MIAALLAAALVLAAPQPQHVIHGDRTAGGIRIAHSTPADVKKLFGAPSTSRVTSSRSCLQSWKGARLAVTFFTFEDKPCVRGVALIVTVTGRAAWRTAIGLRVGDPAARLRSLYPKARLRTGFAGDSGYWLVTRQVCAEVGGGAYPGLLARMKAAAWPRSWRAAPSATRRPSRRRRASPSRAAARCARAAPRAHAQSTRAPGLE